MRIFKAKTGAGAGGRAVSKRHKSSLKASRASRGRRARGFWHMGAHKKVSSEAEENYLPFENVAEPLATHVVERSDPLVSCAKRPDRSERNLIFSEL